ncbi:MAG: hypothetical protein ACE15C_11155 [Phycisphaerae bacterium]
MYASTAEIHVQGRPPTRAGIVQQRSEQIQAMLVLRGILGESSMTVTREQTGYMRRLSRARGLPAR